MAEPSRSDYRQWLVEADHQASQSFDKTLLTLAGGALGVSFAFIKEIVPHPRPETIGWLIASWASFAVALAGVLFSMLTSQLALRRAIRQHDTGRMRDEAPGGGWTSWTWGLTAGAGVIFLAGVMMLVWFAFINLSQGMNR